MMYFSKRWLWLFLIAIFFYIFRINYRCDHNVYKPLSLNQKLKRFVTCNNKRFQFSTEQSGHYWTLKNFIKAEHGQLDCFETITFSTTGDIRCLENIPMLAQRFVFSLPKIPKLIFVHFRWKAPISLALYTPKHLYNDSLQSILYLRNCLPESELIRKFVTFHIFFLLSDKSNIIGFTESVDCSEDPSFLKYKRTVKSNDTFPINVGRNIASSAALTYFHFRCDLELFPSENLAQKFLEFIIQKSHLIHKKNVFIIPAFEISEDSSIPYTLKEMRELLLAKEAVFFYDKNQEVNWCFKFPEKDSWINGLVDKGNLQIHYVTKRLFKYKSIEHFYIGTEDNPHYPEEITWNMRNDKLVHEYLMCLLNYEYYFMAGAYLVHSPGYHTEKSRTNFIFNNNKSVELFYNDLKPLYDSIYGAREGCILQNGCY